MKWVYRPDDGMSLLETPTGVVIRTYGWDVVTGTTTSESSVFVPNVHITEDGELAAYARMHLMPSPVITTDY